LIGARTATPAAGTAHAAATATTAAHSSAHAAATSAASTTAAGSAPPLLATARRRQIRSLEAEADHAVKRIQGRSECAPIHLSQWNGNFDQQRALTVAACDFEAGLARQIDDVSLVFLWSKHLDMRDAQRRRRRLRPLNVWRWT
jgi:hypothetical protein